MITIIAAILFILSVITITMTLASRGCRTGWWTRTAGCTPPSPCPTWELSRSTMSTALIRFFVDELNILIIIARNPTLVLDLCTMTSVGSQNTSNIYKTLTSKNGKNLDNTLSCAYNDIALCFSPNNWCFTLCLIHRSEVPMIVLVLPNQVLSIFPNKVLPMGWVCPTAPRDSLPWALHALEVFGGREGKSKS